MASIFSVKPTLLKEPPKTNEHVLDKYEENDEIQKAIVKDFERANLLVESIQQVKNHHSWMKFKNCKDELNARTPRAPDFQLNEKYLYHGTKKDKDLICEEGFDHRLSSRGRFGKGIYFSDSPEKSAKYSKDYIIVARVLLGAIKEYGAGQDDRSLVREPEKTGDFKGWKYYDSIKGCPKDQNEYVIYTNSHALVDFVVTFSKLPPRERSTTQDLEDPQDATVEKDQKIKQPKAEIDSDIEEQEPVPQIKKDDDSSSSSDSETDHGEENSDSETDDGEENNQEEIESMCFFSIIPYFTLPQGDLSAEKKREIFKSITKENDEEQVEKILKKECNEDLERAIFLFFAYKQVREEEEMREAGQLVEDDYIDDGLPIFPPMDPLYESQEWEALSDDDKKAKTWKMVTTFLEITALTELNLGVASDHCKKTKYNLDTAIMNYYTSWM